MGLFDIFKKKKTDSTFSGNELEKALMQASTKILVRNEFYQKLLWNELIVLTNGDENSDEMVDFIQIDNKGGISDYFLNQTKPFYNRD